MSLGNREDGVKHRPASQETCHQSWSRANTLGGVHRWRL